MSNHKPESNDSKTSYFFSYSLSQRSRDLIGVIMERGPIAALGMFFVLIGVSFALYIWSQQEVFWDESLIFALLVVFWSAWHYLGLVVEIRVTAQHFSFRRLMRFRSIPWEKISRVRLYSLTTMGITYVWITGHSNLPIAVFPLLSGYPPETWKELIRLVEDLKQRGPVKHTM